MVPVFRTPVGLVAFAVILRIKKEVKPDLIDMLVRNEFFKTAVPEHLCPHGFHLDPVAQFNEIAVEQGTDGFVGHDLIGDRELIRLLGTQGPDGQGQKSNDCYQKGFHRNMS